MMDAQQVKNIIEACLLVAGKAMSLRQLDELFEGDENRPDKETIKACIEQLQADYEGRGIELVQVASGFRLQSRTEVSQWVARLFPEKPPRYSRALLETLVLVAYRQPITRGEIEEIRGVAVSSNIVKTLQERQWVKEVGFKDVPGKPALLGTTRQFLDYFNLKRLDDLPPLSEIKNLDEMDAALMEAAGIAPAQDSEAANDGERSDANTEEGVEVSANANAEEGVEVSANANAEEGVEVSANASTEEGVEVSADASTEEGVEVSADANTEEGVEVSADANTEEGVEVSADANTEEGVEVSADANTEEGVEVSANANAEEGIDVSANANAEEGVEVSANANAEEGVEVSANANAEEGVEVSADANTEEGIEVSANANTEEGVEVSANANTEEGVEVSADASVTLTASEVTDSESTSDSDELLDTELSEGDFEHTSFIAGAASGVISGLEAEGLSPEQSSQKPTDSSHDAAPDLSSVVEDSAAGEQAVATENSDASVTFAGLVSDLPSLEQPASNKVVVSENLLEEDTIGQNSTSPEAGAGDKENRNADSSEEQTGEQQKLYSKISEFAEEHQKDVEARDELESQLETRYTESVDVEFADRDQNSNDGGDSTEAELVTADADEQEQIERSSKVDSLGDAIDASSTSIDILSDTFTGDSPGAGETLH